MLFGIRIGSTGLIHWNDNQTGPQVADTFYQMEKDLRTAVANGIKFREDMHYQFVRLGDSGMVHVLDQFTVEVK